MRLVRHAIGDENGPSRRRVVLWTAGGLAALLVVVGGVAAAAVLSLQSNIHTQDLTPALGTDRPTQTVTDSRGHEPLNVLVLGSDSREGANGFVGGKADEGRSDTTLVLHLSADGTRALAVSIPRDSMVDMPTCTDRKGGTKPRGERQFNDAYTIGGAACTQRTVEQLTGLRIDHYVVVDFAGFKGMVDALGTVPICLEKAVNDDRHHIHLPAGRTRVNGTQALAYVRERYALGDGGDLGRIDRQQAFIASVLQEATSAGTLTNPAKLYSFLHAATDAVTMDPQLASISTLTGLAKQVTDVGLGNIQFVTVPTEPYPADLNRLQWAPAASRLWKALRDDTPVSFSASGTSPSAAPHGTAAPTLPGGVEPSQVRVRVLNASGLPGAATAAADDLRAAGWNVISVADADETGLATTRIRYGTGTLPAARARALASVLPGAELVEDETAGTVLRVEVGSDWTGVLGTPRPAPTGSATTGTPTPAPGPVVVRGVSSRTAAGDICSA